MLTCETTQEALNHLSAASILIIGFVIEAIFAQFAHHRAAAHATTARPDA